MTVTADVIVIGAGMAGISAAAEISKEASVLVLESEPTPGYHSSGRTAAIFIRNYGNAVLRALNAASEPFFLTPEGVSDSSLLTPRGELFFAREHELEDLENYMEGSDGLEILTPSEVVELVPILKKDPIVKAAYEPSAQDIDVDRILQGYLRQLRQNGGELLTNSEALEIKLERGIWKIHTPSGALEGKILINAAGAWADVIAERAGVAKVGAIPMRRTGAILPRPEIEGFDRWPLFVSASESFYAKPEAGKLMVSPADEDPVEPHDAWPDDMVLAEGLYRFEEATTLTVDRLEHSWAGLRTFVKDRTPVVGFDPDREGFFWLAGQGGYGIQTAPAMSQLTANLVLGKSSLLASEVIKKLSPARFKSA
ncbi:NAD(P)/FAD-dependent oxidoreductase [Sneathiella limimaris]|uniref:NAD(P)/FAD-dependent oxidoreductase n=1 Tax=Sneathiella limimaris TaxID=1964213 RepID=UPI00146E1477|nr:FAD-binding oxidoreductase [Sneathiella limimaris]